MNIEICTYNTFQKEYTTFLYVYLAAKVGPHAEFTIVNKNHGIKSATVQQFWK